MRFVSLSISDTATRTWKTGTCSTERVRFFFFRPKLCHSPLSRFLPSKVFSVNFSFLKSNWHDIFSRPKGWRPEPQPSSHAALISVRKAEMRNGGHTGTHVGHETSGNGLKIQIPRPIHPLRSRGRRFGPLKGRMSES